jgi:hypothetical protein
LAVVKASKSTHNFHTVRLIDQLQTSPHHHLTEYQNLLSALIAQYHTPSSFPKCRTSSSPFSPSPRPPSRSSPRNPPGRPTRRADPARCRASTAATAVSAAPSASSTPALSSSTTTRSRTAPRPRFTGGAAPQTGSPTDFAFPTNKSKRPPRPIPTPSRSTRAKPRPTSPPWVSGERSSASTLAWLSWRHLGAPVSRGRRRTPRHLQEEARRRLPLSQVVGFETRWDGLAWVLLPYLVLSSGSRCARTCWIWGREHGLEWQRGSVCEGDTGSPYQNTYGGRGLGRDEVKAG